MKTEFTGSLEALQTQIHDVEEKIDEHTSSHDKTKVMNVSIMGIVVNAVTVIVAAAISAKVAYSIAKSQGLAP